MAVWAVAPWWFISFLTSLNSSQEARAQAAMFRPAWPPRRSRKIERIAGGVVARALGSAEQGVSGKQHPLSTLLPRQVQSDRQPPVFVPHQG